ncbi:hypothetical protein [Dyadobacter tibetensis]|uniref:hypothetical protein n=1 Tax=Dyadobacter tibetensis TaxID=1211851 RepID=UPI00046F54B9|nr:hypothetical protein [Dyadobacter tibetensis]
MAKTKYFVFLLLALIACENQSASEKKANADIEKLNKTWVVNSLSYDAGIPDSVRLEDTALELYFGTCNYMDDAPSLLCAGSYTYDGIASELNYQYLFDLSQYKLAFRQEDVPGAPALTEAQKVKLQKVVNLMSGNWKLVADGEMLSGEMKSSVMDHGGLVKFTAKRK